MASFDPDTVVKLSDNSGQWMASFTPGCRTVLLAGPRRTFREGTVVVRHKYWVRSLPEPFDGTVDHGWLKAARKANTKKAPDILEIALQYLGARAEYGGSDDEDSGPGSDFHDYLGIPWKFFDNSGKVSQPETDRFHSIDCSGHLRLVWGFRTHLPNSAPFGTVPLGLREGADTLPRRSYQMARSGPGQLVAPYSKHKPSLTNLQIGDLVFFDRRKLANAECAGSIMWACTSGVIKTDSEDTSPACKPPKGRPSPRRTTTRLSMALAAVTLLPCAPSVECRFGVQARKVRGRRKKEEGRNARHIWVAGGTRPYLDSERKKGESNKSSS